MAYKKIELVEPIYELQEKETLRQYYFFDIFCKVDMDIEPFTKSFKNLTQGSEWCQNNVKIFLEFNPPTPTTMVKWATYLQWRARKKSFGADKIKKIREELQKDLIDFFKEDSANLKKSAKKDWELDDEIDYDDRTPAHLKSKGKNELATAHQKKIDTLLIESGMPKDINQTQSEVNMKMEADVTQQTTAEIKTEKLKELRERMEQMTYD